MHVYCPVTFLIGDLILSQRAGNTAALSRRALVTVRDAPSVSMQTLVRTMSVCVVSLKAIHHSKWRDVNEQQMPGMQRYLDGYCDDFDQQNQKNIWVKTHKKRG